MVITYTVDDDLALAGMPADITTYTASTSGAVVNYTPPTAVDAEPGASVACSPVSGSTFPIATTPVTCTATQAGDANSPLSASFNVTVRYGCNGQAATIVGTAGADRLFGTPGPDVIVGLGGDDSIYGYGGNDVICSGDGNDVVYGGDGNDYIDAGAGDDRASGDSGDDVLLGADGSDRLFAVAGNDALNGGPAADYCYRSTGTTTFTACEIFPAGTA